MFYMYETNYYVSSSHGSAHFDPPNIDRLTKHSTYIVLAEPVKVEIDLINRITPDYHPNGTEYVYLDEWIPRQKLTLKVHEYIKDSTGKFSDELVVYDTASGQIGIKNGDRHKYYNDYSVHHNLQIPHLYFVTTVDAWEADKPQLMSFGGRYDFVNIDGVTHIDSELNRLAQEMREILPYDETKQRLLLIAEDGMTAKDIEKRNQQLLPNLDG